MHTNTHMHRTPQRIAILIPQQNSSKWMAPANTTSINTHLTTSSTRKISVNDNSYQKQTLIKTNIHTIPFLGEITVGKSPLSLEFDVLFRNLLNRVHRLQCHITNGDMCYDVHMPTHPYNTYSSKYDASQITDTFEQSISCLPYHKI